MNDKLIMTKENTAFVNCDGYIKMTRPEEKRVLIHLLFPYEQPKGYISVLTVDQKEIGMIKSIEDFEGESREAIEAEIARKYFIREITGILMLRDKHGTNIWKVIIDGEDEPVEFTVKDSYGNIHKIADGRIIITDSEGNRYQIKDVNKLKKSELRKIELYI